MKHLTWIFDLGLRHIGDQSPRGPGWGLHMLFFCSMALWCMFCFSLGFPNDWVFVLFSIVGVADCIGTYFLIKRNAENVWRLGPLGLFRPRFWIESSAIALTLGFSFGVFAITGGIPGLANWQQPIFATATKMCPVFVTASYFLTLFAFAIGTLTRRFPRGRSLEFVNFFFWCMIGSRLLDFVLPHINVVTTAVAIVFVSLALLVGAGLMALRSTTKRSPQVEKSGVSRILQSFIPTE